MNRNLVLQGTSLLSILLASFHLVDDLLYGSDKSVAVSLLMAVILAVWLYGTLAMAERAAGQVVMLLGALLGLTVFMTHLTGTGGLAGREIGKLSGTFFFVWTLLALAVLSLVSLALSARNLLSLRR